MILNPAVITDIKSIINTAIDTERVLMYWHIGQKIFLEEQEGKDRADYGKFLLKHIADSLEPEFGTGFSVRHLEMCRKFCRVFPIANTRNRIKFYRFFSPKSAIKPNSDKKRFEKRSVRFHKQKTLID